MHSVRFNVLSGVQARLHCEKIWERGFCNTQNVAYTLLNHRQVSDCIQLEITVAYPAKNQTILNEPEMERMLKEIYYE